MDYRKRPPPGHRKPGTERTYPRTPGIQPQAQIIPQEWQKQIHPHFLRPAYLWKLRSAYDQFHFHRKENYRQTLFSLLLPYAQEKQAVVYRKIYLGPNRWRVCLQLHSQYAQRSKGILSGNEHTGTGTAATLRRYLLPGGRHCPGRIAGSVSYAPHRHRQGRGLRKRRQNQNRL